jgi:EamA domain-containing membrane protein RarD
MGLASYLLPTMMWLIAVTAFEEALVAQDIICIVGIWIGVLVFFKRKSQELSHSRTKALMQIEIPAAEAF